MTKTIRISGTLVHEAQNYSKIYNRFVPKQIEFWSKIGKIAEENPEMSYDEIRMILSSLEEKKFGDVEDFEFST